MNSCWLSLCTSDPKRIGAKIFARPPFVNRLPGLVLAPPQLSPFFYLALPQLYAVRRIEVPLGPLARGTFSQVKIATVSTISMAASRPCTFKHLDISVPRWSVLPIRTWPFRLTSPGCRFDFEPIFPRRFVGRAVYRKLSVPAVFERAPKSNYLGN